MLYGFDKATATVQELEDIVPEAASLTLASVNACKLTARGFSSCFLDRPLTPV
jgi:hypothetical protein